MPLYKRSNSLVPLTLDGASTQDGNMSQSLKLGLSLGLPLGTVGFCLILALWYFFKRKHSSMVMFRDDFFDVGSRASDIKNRFFGELDKQYHSSGETLTLRHGAKRSSLQRHVPSAIVPQQVVSPVVPQVVRTPTSFGLMSPIFLKKFHLAQPPQRRHLALVSEVDLGLESKGESDHRVTPKLPPLISTFAAEAKSIHKVVTPYQARLMDEFTVCRGDTVCILQEFTDQWAMVEAVDVRHHPVSERGMIPLVCLGK